MTKSSQDLCQPGYLDSCQLDTNVLCLERVQFPGRDTNALAVLSLSMAGAFVVVSRRG